MIQTLINNGIKVAAIALQELWNLPHPELLKIPNYQLFFKQRNNARGGGVGFYVREDIPTKVNQLMSPFYEKILESLTIEILLNKKKIYLTSFYRPPNNDAYSVELFFEHFEALLNNFNRNDNPYFIFGDSNINLLKLKDCKMAQNYLNTAHSSGFINGIFKATRIQNEKFSLIDHILSKNEPSILSFRVITSDISDHFITALSFCLDKQVEKPTNSFIRNFGTNNMNMFRNTLNSLSWNNVLECNDTNQAFDEFFNVFKDLFELHFPLEPKKSKNKNLYPINDFMTPGLLISRTRKDLLHKQYLINRNEINFHIYKTYRNIYNSTIKASKKLVISKNLVTYKNKPKKIWEIYNDLTVGNKAKSKTFELNINGNICTNNKKIANKFNTFFSTIGKNIASTIPSYDIDPKSFFTVLNPPELLFNETSGGEILAVIRSLEPKSSPDIFGICPKLIKFVDTAISIPLAHIISLSFRDGIFPEKLKTSRVVPIFKAGCPTDCNNYRPISLVSTFAKIFEKIVSIKLKNHLDIHKLLVPNQFGFQKKISTEHCITQLTNYVSDAINQNKFAIGVFLDLQKAFDVVDHNILLGKLENLGIKNKVLEWFRSYLSNRSQIVDINGEISEEAKINISVMQGSILGPLLFLIFINDLPNASELLRLLLFADDTCALDSDNDLNLLITRVNAELKKLATGLLPTRSLLMLINVNI